jgi:hypothetical protein
MPSLAPFASRRRSHILGTGGPRTSASICARDDTEAATSLSLTDYPEPAGRSSDLPAPRL